MVTLHAVRLGWVLVICATLGVSAPVPAVDALTGCRVHCGVAGEGAGPTWSCY